jgi:hypothetical protein
MIRYAKIDYERYGKCSQHRFGLADKTGEEIRQIKRAGYTGFARSSLGMTPYSMHIHENYNLLYRFILISISTLWTRSLEV